MATGLWFEITLINWDNPRFSKPAGTIKANVHVHANRPRVKDTNVCSRYLGRKDGRYNHIW